MRTRSDCDTPGVGTLLLGRLRACACTRKKPASQRLADPATRGFSCRVLTPGSLVEEAYLSAVHLSVAACFERVSRRRPAMVGADAAAATEPTEQTAGGPSPSSPSRAELNVQQMHRLLHSMERRVLTFNASGFAVFMLPRGSRWITPGA